ncbi:hypothetical protein N5P37_005163 [Trichoderma harzianum]|uniref:Abscission/NoCut checkpoint regulator n=1 Tax=Trichoderma harzianum CBS 226.95 TaxID=983964 RepID=A0A2T4ACY6_TRIHA|nr:hypothetical protein M431DRAFT_495120 [Trichoderma harzianum CBS 226.95]KAK0762351.1 hypothetical protein N5P37_005163 [Trichoderma harzianum]PKK49040.1 hypothetical protein CI102_8156 [Trichoderma harzianum]PTB54892.1 hypothetical protein M431DRAFT_495120 [Trichoderma harzianum CBS 226.95]
MPEDLDNSLLERLQALRGSSSGASPGQAAPIKFDVDLIERSKPATREDTLAARLKSLRERDDGSASPKTEKVVPAASSATSGSHPAKAKDVVSTSKSAGSGDGDDVDLMFSTDDQTLEELLNDVSLNDNPVEEPSDEQVKALLENLSLSVPKDDAGGDETENKGNDSDDSDGEHMQSKVKDIIAQFKDEIELEAALGNHDDEADSEKQDQDEDGDGNDGGDADLALPSLPSNLADLPNFAPQRPANMNDITARMAALKAPSTEDSFSLPSVPSSKPSAGDKPVKRLTSKTDYTDDDIDGWCTVCLNDATLRCIGCDGDPYCTRCWREMHIGPAAAFDDRSHKAVQFTKAKKKDKQRVALGA